MKAMWMVCLVLPSLSMAATWQSFVESGWKVEKAVDGDLNADGRADKVLVLQQQDPKKWRANAGLGTDKLDLNPRRLLVLLQDGQGWKQAARNDRILPSANSLETPCLADPLENGGIGIKKGVLGITLNYWLSCGSYGTSNKTYRFRHEQGRWPLIGLEDKQFSRSTHDEDNRSYNFVTGKAIVGTLRNSDIGSDDNRETAKEHSENVRNPRLDLNMRDFNQRFDAWQQSQQ